MKNRLLNFQKSTIITFTTHMLELYYLKVWPRICDPALMKESVWSKHLWNCFVTVLQYVQSYLFAEIFNSYESWITRRLCLKFPYNVLWFYATVIWYCGNSIPDTGYCVKGTLSLTQYMCFWGLKSYNHSKMILLNTSIWTISVPKLIFLQVKSTIFNNLPYKSLRHFFSIEKW